MLLSDFIDYLINNQESLVEYAEDNKQVDIHLDLDHIKKCANIKTDLDSKSLLALALVLLKQIQPFVSDFEAQEQRFDIITENVRLIT
jgi:hypothetical protein